MIPMPSRVLYPSGWNVVGGTERGDMEHVVRTSNHWHKTHNKVVRKEEWPADEPWKLAPATLNSRSSSFNLIQNSFQTNRKKKKKKTLQQKKPTRSEWLVTMRCNDKTSLLALSSKTFNTQATPVRPCFSTDTLDFLYKISTPRYRISNLPRTLGLILRQASMPSRANNDNKLGVLF